MSYFLWIEDFENEPKVTASYVFGGILNETLFAEDKRAIKKGFRDQGVFVELNFQDGLGFIKGHLDKIDYIILDIDLPAYGIDGINNEVLEVLKDFEGYQVNEDKQIDEGERQTACNELKKIAGFYLYTKLVVELGFPKQHILFCSNHGENTKTIQEAFKTAKIVLPKIYQKSDADVRQWVKERFENPYSRLRRGIIEGCQYAKTLAKENLYFNKFTPKQDGILAEDVISYFEVLEGFLPLREPKNKKTLYKLFIRTLSHEWEAAKNIKPDKEKPDAVLAWIMRNTRHWITHNSSLFNDTDEQLLAFLFMVNMRVMFSHADYSIHNYESILLKLFDNESLSAEELNGKSIPVTEAYLDLRNIIRDQNQERKNLNIEEAFHFNEMANNVQLSNSSLRNDRKLFTKLLYQMFWLTTCNPYV
ncbi:MAG: hypothetical protein KGZ88_22295, partial [Methylomicrobium sp.]|nr:hypothetical protein [Methylomicrobium sp.]